eukprot:TRINITY_DN108741_c0_g1_i1.p1 TRINITY_DN108741_c0_g1~~TRINITY_DN108741_c0_g1_i1.p1  ORF type:complete len:545 (-),score=76.60 TRINITY_DN108741_c0_g1_i1:56-1690(-)
MAAPVAPAQKPPQAPLPPPSSPAPLGPAGGQAPAATVIGKSALAGAGSQSLPLPAVAPPRAVPPKGSILQPLPRILGTHNAEPGSTDTLGDLILEVLALICGFLAVLCVVGMLVTFLVPLFRELQPSLCPVHHVECSEKLRLADPRDNAHYVLGFFLCAVMCPVSLAFCAGNCICCHMCFVPEEAQRRLERIGKFFRQKWNWLRSSAQGCASHLRHLPGRLTGCCRRKARRISPDELSNSKKRRCFEEDQGFDSPIGIVPTKPNTREPKEPCMAPIIEQDDLEQQAISKMTLQRAWRQGVSTAPPRYWSQAGGKEDRFKNIVELDPLEGEGAEIAKLVLSDETWHCPPECVKVLRIEHSAKWGAYITRKTQLLSKISWAGFDAPRCDPAPVTQSKLPAGLLEGLDSRVNEQVLLFGTTMELADLAEQGKIPQTPENEKYSFAIAPHLSGGSQFCESGFVAHEQAVDAGYMQPSQDSTWAVLVCRVLLGKPLHHTGLNISSRLCRDWESGRYGCIVFDDRVGRREFLLMPDSITQAYPEYIVVLR